ncbi:MAG TPA: DUF6298 domain-containing protein [Acidobacteriaceae bacterium]|nr:DUF6298 domain-containing protein [Acidobacteriaceae bacterium]
MSAALFVGAAHAEEAVRIHPDNPHYLLFRGKPLGLISASEHYGSVINRPFDFERYLDDAAAHKMTMTRTFLLYREQQSARNPSSPCKPESPDFITPFVRKGPGKALDGEPVYDLDSWNPEYFDRLHRFLDAASKRGIVVELTVFSNSYSPDTWALNPFRAENNLQHVGKIEWEEYITLKDKELVRRQKEFARKIIQETSQYDNVYYEICNEPGGGIAGHATPEDVDAWQREMGQVMRDEMRRLKRPHLLSGQQAFSYASHNGFPMDATYANDTVDIANDHPLPNTQLDGKVFEMGDFMSKELMLQQVGDYCRAAYAHPKPSVLDEDNTASIYRDPVGWTIHRKRAWTALLSGCHYDYIDFSITVGSEAGTRGSQAGIRSWMQHLSEFVAGYDLVHSHPDTNWIRSAAGPVALSGLVTSHNDYVAYLGDSREVTDAAAGEPIHGSVTLMLPPGSYDVSLYSPVTGEASPAMVMHGGANEKLELPRFQEDLVIRATLRKE